MKNQGIKIVAQYKSCLDNNKYYSYAMLNKGKVRYKLHQWTTAPKWLQERGYFLIYFDSIENAIKWSDSPDPDNSEYSFWLVEVEEEINPLPPRRSHVLVDRGLAPETIAELEQDVRQPKNIDYNQNCWPEGTKMAKKIKLVKKISTEKIRSIAKQ